MDIDKAAEVIAPMLASALREWSGKHCPDPLVVSRAREFARTLALAQIPDAAAGSDLRDSDGNYLGKVGTTCEHRSVGDHRAWCFNCAEWCYPNSPCGQPAGCSTIALEAKP